MHIYTKKGTNEHKPIGAFLYISIQITSENPLEPCRSGP